MKRSASTGSRINGGTTNAGGKTTALVPPYDAYIKLSKM